MNEERIDILADKWFKGTISTAERQELEAWYAAYNNMEQEVNSDLDEEAFGNTLFNVIAARAGIEPARITADGERVATKTKLWSRVAAVSTVWKIAAAVAVMTLGIWLFYTSGLLGGRHLEGSNATRDLSANDIPPGRNTATITFDDGEVIKLSDAKTGVIVHGGLKYNDESEIASSLRFPRNDEVETLTASTPRGGTYQVTLPDGTRVWLNADTKISFPSQFVGRERKVLLTSGEAYFEVSKNKRMPFIVESKGQQVTVLGTHFNINSYADDGSTKTTLLEGSVKISPLSSRANAKDLILKPNEQASLKGEAITIKQINPMYAISWKNNKFMFDSEPIEQIMKKVARWYDIDVIYEGKKNTESYSGTIGRSENISELLKMLERTNTVEFEIRGKCIFRRN